MASARSQHQTRLVFRSVMHAIKAPVTWENRWFIKHVGTQTDIISSLSVVFGLNPFWMLANFTSRQSYPHESLFLTLTTGRACHDPRAVALLPLADLPLADDI